MEKHIVTLEIKKYLSEQFCCKEEELETAEVIYTCNSKKKKAYVKIMAYKECVVVSASEDMLSTVQSATIGKSRDEIFEIPFVYGQTIHYVPDITKFCEPVLHDGYTYELLCKEEIKRLAGISGFDNSLVFDADGNTNTCMVLVAKENGKVIAIAGAGAETETMWEVGVDVKKEHRNGGLATKMVMKLTMEILKRGIIPFYSASVTNIASQMVAARSGYIPCWVDTYGTVFDSGFGYGDYMEYKVENQKIR